MAIEKTTALVLRSVDFSETSKVLTMFSRDFGKIRALAKGGRRLKSSFEVALDLLSLCSISVLRKSSGGLDLLTEAVLAERFDGLRRDLAALYAAYYIAEILDGLTENDDPHPLLFDRTIDVLRQLATGGDRKWALINYQLQLLKEIGYAPSLETCIHCGQNVKLSAKTAYSVASGGLVCPDCTRLIGGLMVVQGATVQLMRRFMTDMPDPLKGITVRDASKNELWLITSRSIFHALGKQPKMAALLQL